MSKTVSEGGGGVDRRRTWTGYRDERNYGSE